MVDVKATSPCAPKTGAHTTTKKICNSLSKLTGKGYDCRESICRHTALHHIAFANALYPLMISSRSRAGMMTAGDEGVSGRERIVARGGLSDK